jgi:sugar (pentulose or hexulose) kinase
MDKAIAVIDIGMTNKKVAVYDARLRSLETVSRNFEPIRVEGLAAHDLAAMEDWFLDALASLSKRFDIGAIAVTTHGATEVCLDGEGKPCAPCLLYTHEPGPAFHERFYAAMGDPRELQAVTGTPNFSAMINPAKGLFFLEERFPEAFARTRWVLNYPQYWGYLLSGEMGAEGTFTGCHSYLWDWKAEGYSSVARSLGIAEKLPFPLRASWDVLGTLRPETAARTGIDRSAVVTMGIHDSNASLLPHLAKRSGGDFILNSTGTWCVLMHPQERYGFAPEELGKVVFFNRSAYNKPIKTAIFLGGMEYEAWTGAIAKVAGIAPAGLPEPSAADYRAVVEARSEFILPEVVPGTGQFPGQAARARQGGSDYALGDIDSLSRVPGFLRDPARALATLNLSLALQTLVALERAGLGPSTSVFTEGGFRKNAGYNALLASALEGRSGGAYLTDIAEATAFGAAMTAAAALRGEEPGGLGGLFEIDYKRVLPMEGIGSGLEAYRSAWTAAMGPSGGKR